MSLIVRILLLALALPFVLANDKDDRNCGRNQFRWKPKDCCLPNGGPRSSHDPPSGKDCPNNWSWNDGLGCCAPHFQTDDSAPPQCRAHWKWSDSSLCCNPAPTDTNLSNPSRPSNKPGDDDDDDDDHNGDDHNGDDHNGDDHNGDDKNKPGHKRFAAKKRQYRSRNIAPCAKGLSPCPFSSLIGGDYECVNTLSDLDNCGGCAALGEGQNCNAIPGVWNVECEQSSCKIYTCADGYVLSADGKTCNPL